jgi:hypothetical protein
VERTEFGEEVGKDEINWWITKKEHSPEEMRARTAVALDSAERLKTSADLLRKKGAPDSYEELLSRLHRFASDRAEDIDVLYDYVTWLAQRHELAPAILYTYRVWGSSRRADRLVEVHERSVLTPELTKHLGAIVLGLHLGNWYTYDRVYMDLSYDLYESLDPENRVSDLAVEVSREQTAQRTAWEVFDECAVYFRELRDSFQNILLDIDKLSDERGLIHSASFWRSFISTAIRVHIAEPQVWDFKETLEIWRATKDAKAKATVGFVEDIAAFANARGGVLVVGVTDGLRRKFWSWNLSPTHVADDVLRRSPLLAALAVVATGGNRRSRLGFISLGAVGRPRDGRQILLLREETNGAAEQHKNPKYPEPGIPGTVKIDAVWVRWRVQAPVHN